MSNFTLNTVLESIKSDIQDVLSRLSQDEINELTSSGVCELLDENCNFFPCTNLEFLNCQSRLRIIFGIFK